MPSALAHELFNPPRAVQPPAVQLPAPSGREGSLAAGAGPMEDTDLLEPLVLMEPLGQSGVVKKAR